MIVPFVLIYLFNWVVFVIIIASLLYKTIKSGKLKKSDKRQDMKKWKQQLMVAITLSIMFGLGWGIGLPATQALYTTAVRDTFSVLFILLTAFQGLFIFIMRCARSNEVAKQWKKWFWCVKTKKSEDVTSSFYGKSRHPKSGATGATQLTSFSSTSGTIGKYVVKTSTKDGLAMELSNYDQDRNRTLKRNVFKSDTLSEAPTAKDEPLSVPELVAKREEALNFVDVDDFDGEQAMTAFELPTDRIGSIFENPDKLSLGAETGPEWETTYFGLPTLTYSPSNPSLHAINTQTDAHFAIFDNPMLQGGEEDSNL